MEIQELLHLNSGGLIPGPNETKEAFCQRVEVVKKFFNHPNSIPGHHWDWAKEQLQKLYDFSPQWCTAFYSNQKLAPWQAAATWIQQNEPNVKPVYMIQLRSSKWVRYFVDRDEILAHEAVHAARAAFHEPKTEELFAYLTSTSKWRKVLGPLFQRPSESLLWVGVVLAGSILQIFDSLWDTHWSDFCFLMAALLILFFGFRLFRMRWQIKVAAEKLIPFLKNPEKVRAVLFRLTDEEIDRLAKGQGIQEKADLRWRLIRAAYFK